MAQLGTVWTISAYQVLSVDATDPGGPYRDVTLSFDYGGLPSDQHYLFTFTSTLIAPDPPPSTGDYGGGIALQAIDGNGNVTLVATFGMGLSFPTDSSRSETTGQIIFNIPAGAALHAGNWGNEGRTTALSGVLQSVTLPA